MVDPRGKLKYVFNFVFFKSFILMFQLGFELSYPRLDASITPLPLLPFYVIKIKYFGDFFQYILIYLLFKDPFFAPSPESIIRRQMTEACHC